MKLIYKLFHLNPDNREGVVTATSILGIIINILIAAIKVAIGAAVSSIAIISEGVNNASDAVTSVLAILGTKLANKRPDKKHPFGYGRIEYLTSLIIAVIIIVSGVQLLSDSIRLIFRPEEMSISYITLIILGGSALIKFLLGVYTIRVGKKVDSGSLVAVGTECRNDSYASAITIVTGAVFLIFHLSLDAYAGIIISGIILKAGIEILLDTVSELLGRPGKEELAHELYKEIRATEGIVNAADLMLHNYGPESYSGSVNVEIDHSMSIGDAYAFLHRLQLRIMHEHHVTMVFGIYAVDNDSPDSRELRKAIAAFVRDHEHINSYHAVYLAHEENRIYCDLIVDYELRDWQKVRDEFTEYIAGLYPEQQLELTIETEFV